MMSLPCKIRTLAFESTFGMYCAMVKVAPLGLLSHICNILLCMSGERSMHTPLLTAPETHVPFSSSFMIPAHVLREQGNLLL